MKKFSKLVFSFILISSVFSTATAQKDFTKYVDPTIGNVSQFLVPTYPTFQLPNQQLRMFPIKTDYIADQVTAWPLQVMTHRDAGILRMKVTLGKITNKSWSGKMTIDHDREIVRPWHYSTYLVKEDITVSFTPSKKSAIYKVDFPAKTQKNILISGSDKMLISKTGNNSFTLQETISYMVRGVKPTERTMLVYCYAEVVDVNGNAPKNMQLTSQKNNLSITSNSSQQETILLKYAISYISLEQAKKNFAMEVANQNFDQTKEKGQQAWGEVIDQIEVTGGTEAQRRSFYTALYRTYERMVDVNEYGQFYSGYDGKVHKSNRPFYVDDWVWDTYLAKHPLNAILNPQMQSDQLDSYVKMYEHSGWMATFPQVHGNHLCMNGYHTVSLFLDAKRKGIEGFDLNKAYEGMKKTLAEATYLPWRQGHKKVAFDHFYDKHGYFPALHPGEPETEPLVDVFEKRQSVAISLGMSYDVWCMAELAKEMGKTDDYKKYNNMSPNYKKLWHEEMQLFMPKDDQGEWIMIDPKLDGGKGFRDYYDENNGWTYAWWVQHDIDGLISLLYFLPSNCFTSDSH